MSGRPPSFPPSGRTAVDERRRGGGGEPVRATGEAVEAPRTRPTGVRRVGGAPARVSGGLEDRLAERQRARRRLRVRALVVAGVVALLLGGGAYVSLFSPVLALQGEEITITGTDEIASERDVLALVEPYEGEPLLRIDTVGLREELLEVTGVLDVVVMRDFPNGLTVAVEPRVPVATVEEDGEFVLLDGEGVVLARTESPREGVPQVQVPVGTEDTAAALTAVLSVMAALPPSLLGEVTEASAASSFEVEFTLDQGSTVIWGSAEDNALKVAALEVLLQIDAEVYDVSAPESPITR